MMVIKFGLTSLFVENQAELNLFILEYLWGILFFVFKLSQLAHNTAQQCDTAASTELWAVTSNVEFG